jgi:hypothetical protein
MSKKLSNKLGKLFKKNKRQVVIGAAVVGFAILGIVALRLSSAATTAVAIEAESGTLSGNTATGQTAGASGDASVKFGTGGGNPNPNPNPPQITGKRIAYSADGNDHDDDDWASSAFVFAILAKKGMKANLVHYDYNDHIWESNSEGPGEMRTSVNGAVQRWGFDASNVFDDLEQYDAAQANLIEEINKSTASDELWLSLAGPMETSWRALNAANAEARKHVKCVSHGTNSFNQTHATTHGGHSYDDLIDLGCQRVNIPNQNSKMGPVDVGFWDPLNESSDPNLKWLFTRFEPASQSRGDISDAGMIWYTVTGDENGTREQVLDLLLGS